MGGAKNIDLPINGNRASPLINGALRDGNKPETSTASADSKSKLCEGKKRGLKRKRNGSSSESSPVMFAKLLDDSCSRPSTPLLSEESENVESSSKNSNSSTSLCSQTSTSSQIAKTSVSAESEHVECTSTASTAMCTGSATASVCSQSKVETSSLTLARGGSQETVLEDSKESYNSEPDCGRNTRTGSQMEDESIGSRTESQKDAEGTNMKVAEKREDIEQNATALLSEEQTHTPQDLTESLCCTDSTDQKTNSQNDIGLVGDTDSEFQLAKENSRLEKPADLTVDGSCVSVAALTVEMSGNGNSSIHTTLHSDSVDQYKKKTYQHSVIDETMHVPLSECEQHSPKELLLDMSVQASGINGRYNEDGEWYDWSQVMPVSEGTLNILPYVILE